MHTTAPNGARKNSQFLSTATRLASASCRGTPIVP